MTTDLGPSCDAVAALVRRVPDTALASPTPCPAYTVGDLLDHLGGLCLAFTAAARKQALPGGPSGEATRLEDGWRERIATDLAALAEAWRDPAAHEGMTRAGPVDLPAEVAAAVALDEVVVHGWDLAVATGQPFAPDPVAVEVCRRFVDSFESPADRPTDGPTDGAGLFGPPVPVDAAAPPLHHLLAGTGRDPQWTA